MLNFLTNCKIKVLFDFYTNSLDTPRIWRSLVIIITQTNVYGYSEKFLVESLMNDFGEEINKSP